MAVEIFQLTNSSKDLNRFIKSQWLFYKDDPYFVPPLLIDKKKQLDININPFFQHAKIQFFLAIDNDIIVGRIAAIINENHNLTHNEKTGFLGFFECIDNQIVANLLFDSVKNWLKSQGMTIMRGPENPSLNDEAGLLIDGFDSSPLIMMTYNPPYYQRLIENYGFLKSMDLYAYVLYNDNYKSEKMNRLQDIIRKRYDVRIRNIDFKNKDRFAEDVEIVKQIFNTAWENNWGFVKFTEDEIKLIAKDLKQIAEPSLAFIVEVKGKPAGFCITVPNINECLVYNKSGRLLSGIWHILTKKKKISFVRIIALGILPEYRNIGVDAVMYYETGKRAADLGIYKGEASWILENNLMMNRALTVTMNNKIYKTYRIYDLDIK